MGRVLAGAAVIAAVLVLAGESLPRMWSLISPAPGCELALADGSSVTVAPDRAAALTTAALTDPASPDRVSVETPGAVTCTLPGAGELAAQQPGESGLTPRAAAVHEEVRAAFGKVPAGGFAPQGVSSGHGARSAHYEGRAVDYFFRPVGDEQQRARGWALANWLVANASRLEIAVVIFDDQIWSARRSGEGWRAYRNPDGGTDPISRHLDHVHVDVIRGG